MPIWGFAFIVIGIFAALAGYLIDPTVATTDPAAYEIFGERMPDPRRLEIKIGVAAAGGFLIQTGIIVFCLGIVGDKVDALKAALNQRD